MYTSTNGHKNLPRYFSRVFDIASGMTNGTLDMVLPDGRCFRAIGKNPEPHATMQVHNPDVFARLVREGDLGFSEAYMDGWWNAPDLQAFMDLMHADNYHVYDGFPAMGLARYYEKLRYWWHSNSRRQARKNISHHYDLGNDFYSAWLDKTMTYSSAKFQSDDESLEAAQTRKYASLVDQMGAKPGDHVLEIGCGWGGFAEYAAGQRGLRVTALTISKEQRDFAVARVEKAGLSDLVEIKMQDYRDETGIYDGVASIEMFEAVGQKYWPVYFDALRDRLKPGKNATLQVITVQDRRFEVYQRGVDFIQKYIFPGGMLPSPTALRDEVEKSGLKVSRSIEFGESYSHTLRRWHQRFNNKWDKISKKGFDDRFFRMWNFYLTSCAASFHSGNCNVTQITVTKPV